MADFHPIDCHVFAFATSKGAIRMADLRASALADNTCKSFEEVRLRTAPDCSTSRQPCTCIVRPVAEPACPGFLCSWVAPKHDDMSCTTDAGGAM